MPRVPTRRRPQQAPSRSWKWDSSRTTVEVGGESLPSGRVMIDDEDVAHLFDFSRGTAPIATLTGASVGPIESEPGRFQLIGADANGDVVRWGIGSAGQVAAKRPCGCGGKR